VVFLGDGEFRGDDEGEHNLLLYLK
jgi:hypothetical protein